MEQKLVKVPFEVEMAKKITNGEVEGKIVTREGNSVRIVCWDKKDITYNIASLVDNGDEEDFKSYTNEGIWNTDKTCTLKRYDLMLEIPEYMTFKDGDVLYVRLKNNNWYIFIYSCNSEYKTNSYAALGDNGRLWIEDNYITSNDCISELRFATEEEKQILVERLKASKQPKDKEYLKRFFNIEVKPECEFKPFDKVIVRDGDSALITLCEDCHSWVHENGNEVYNAPIKIGDVVYYEHSDYDNYGIVFFINYRERSFSTLMVDSGIGFSECVIYHFQFEDINRNVQTVEDFFSEDNYDSTSLFYCLYGLINDNPNISLDYYHEEGSLDNLNLMKMKFNEMLANNDSLNNMYITAVNGNLSFLED